MVHDYWTWRDDPAFVRRQLAGTRTVLDWFTERLRPDGLLGRLPWWNFVDWCDDFAEGVPPQDADGGSVPLSLQLALALREAADLEQALGEPERAARHRQRADAIVAGPSRRLAWDEGRGLVADTPARKRFSQQTNILALLAGAVPAGQAKPLLDRILAMPRPSIQDAGSHGHRLRRRSRGRASTSASTSRARWRRSGEGERYLPELEPWREMLDVGLSTFAEIPSAGTRSDCHAWSAHPNYDLLRIVAGVKPGAPGLRAPSASSPTSARSTASTRRCPTRAGRSPSRTAATARPSRRRSPCPPASPASSPGAARPARSSPASRPSASSSASRVILRSRIEPGDEGSAGLARRPSSPDPDEAPRDDRRRPTAWTRFSS